MDVRESEVVINELMKQYQNVEDEREKEKIAQQMEQIKKEVYESLDAWDIVYLARHQKRPKAMDYIEALFTDFIELHGDRLFQDDKAICGGIAKFHGMPVTILAQCKGRNMQENMERNYGMLHPEGYRKAMRLAQEAARFHRPIITFIDTPGAYPGKGAEERGQAEAIAKCLQSFASLETCVIAVVLSEGGSGGALAFSVCDHMMMLEHAMYSILSPEGFASILWKDESKAKDAAKLMGITARQLKEKGFIDTIIPEPKEGAHVYPPYVYEQLDHHLLQQLQILMKQKPKTLLANRYKKIRNLGVDYVL